MQYTVLHVDAVLGGCRAVALPIGESVQSSQAAAFTDIIKLSFIKAVTLKK